jgi:hypothetical protein
MGNNAASFLKEFFECGYAKDAINKGFVFTDLIAALSEIEDVLKQWSDLGSTDAEAFEEALPAWYGAVLAATNSRGELVPFVNNSAVRTDMNLHAGDKLALTWVSEKMAGTSPSFDESSREKIAEALVEVRGLLKEEDLPLELLTYLDRLIRETQTALDEYDLTGDFKLSLAFDRLSNALRKAESASKDKEGWGAFMRDFLLPVVSGLAVNAIGWGLTSAQILPAIGS